MPTRRMHTIQSVALLCLSHCVQRTKPNDRRSWTLRLAPIASTNQPVLFRGSGATNPDPADRPQGSVRPSAAIPKICAVGRFLAWFLWSYLAPFADKRFV